MMNCSSCFTRHVNACTLFRKEILRHSISTIRHDMCEIIGHAILPLVDAGVEYAFTLLGSTLTACRLFPVTLLHDIIRTSGMYE
jgi:hypothetical protein